jgi:hypothetical protein
MKTPSFLVVVVLSLLSCQDKSINSATELTSKKLVENNSGPEIVVEMHSRVDTTKQEIKEIFELWSNYLKSQPDQITDNPYWNSEEKKLYQDFDFSSPYLYQFPSQQLLAYYKPKVLSIEKEGGNYGIKTIFAADGLEGAYRKSNPWCITKLYAVEEKGQWKLKNALPIITENWNRKTVGKITFIYPSQHTFQPELAKKANQFCDSVTQEFQFPEWKPFEFYITNSGDELGELLNFDFYFAGYTTGVGMKQKRILLSGLGSEYYPHEFIHMITPQYVRHKMMEEGFATWKGGSAGKSFEESAKVLATEIDSNGSVTFDEVINKKWGWQFSAFYVTGAVLFQAAYEKGGTTLVKQLLEIPEDNEILIKSVCNIFEIERENLDDFWRKEVLKYKGS